MAEQVYKDYPQVMDTKGVVARYAFDRCPEGTFLNLQNWEARQENALSSRLGRIPLTSDGVNDHPLADLNVHTLAYMRGLGNNIYRYAGAGANIYRRAGSTGGAFTLLPFPSFYANVGYGFDGDRFSAAQYRPSFNANPWIFFADDGAMLKDNGLLNPLELWGIFAPNEPPTVVLFGTTSNTLVNSLIIDDFFANSGYTFTNCSFNSILQYLTTTLSIGNFETGWIIPLFGTTPPDGSIILVDTGGNQEEIYLTSTSTTVFQNLHNTGAVAIAKELVVNLTATEPAIIQKSNLVLNLNLTGAAADASDYISFFVKPGTANVVGGSVEIDFDVSDGTFTNYYKATAAIPALGSQPIIIQRSAFTAVGTAGSAGTTWANVVAYRIKVTPPSLVTSGTFYLSSLVIYGFGGPDSTAGGAVPYDYRITYFNINTGAESNPSVPLILSRYINPADEPVFITWPNLVGSSALPDFQVTHVRIYRRGGFLTAGWFFVAQVPAANGGYVDSATDFSIASNNLLQIDNDPPVTTTLSVPVNTSSPLPIQGQQFSNAVTPVSMAGIFPNQVLTVDVGNNQETVIVISTTATTFAAYFQSFHPSNTSITASTRVGTPMNLVACAFEQMWLAGDPQNPNRLYYSKATITESFPPQNYIEIGVPSDPIMAVVVLRGQLFVFTMARVYRVVVYPGITPTAYPTGARHGLISNWAWCIAEGQIFYRSADGIYVFNGDDSQYVSAPVEWLFMQKEPNLGPVPTDLLSLNPINQNVQNILMAYNKNEIFYSYLGTGNVQVRMIFDWTYKRWRNDTCDYSAMNTEEDSQIFVTGRGNGMIYIDRSGDADFNSTNNPTPISLDLETPALDQGFPKNNKVYNEFTIDIDLNGQALTATLIFDKGRETEDDTNVFTLLPDVGREQFQFQIQNGQGVLAKTISLLLAGTVTSVVTVYEWHIKAAVDAELRQSYDSYWAKDGTDEYKIMKQGYFEYVAADPAGLNVAVYFDGSDNPSFSFNLAQSFPEADPYAGETRTVKLVRFPAFKYKTRRIVITSASDFQMYGESFVEIKPITTEKGYAKAKFGNVTAQGNV